MPNCCFSCFVSPINPYIHNQTNLYVLLYVIRWSFIFIKHILPIVRLKDDKKPMRDLSSALISLRPYPHACLQNLSSIAISSVLTPFYYFCTRTRVNILVTFQNEMYQMAKSISSYQITLTKLHA